MAADDNTTPQTQGTDNDDMLEGGAGDDTIVAGGGDDTALGGGGNDVMTGDSDNLIQNGSFEDTTGTTSAAWGAYGNALAGWTVSGGQAELVEGEGTDGTYAFDTSGTSAQGGVTLSQTIDNLDAGSVYTLSFDVSERAVEDGASMEVYWNGELMGTVNPNTTDVLTYSFDLEAGIGDGTNTLSFAGMGATENGLLLDNVRMVEGDVEGDDRLEGRTGEDVLQGQGGDDLLVGGGAGSEWSLVNGKWVYDGSQVNTGNDPYLTLDGSDDIITGGVGEDVLLGNAGNDSLFGGAGDDRINAGIGDDRALGGTGADIINLEQGDDYAEGGLGADIVNAGDGDDVVYGDVAEANLLSVGAEGATTFAKFNDSPAWTAAHDEATGYPEMSQTVMTEAGETYTLNFDLAANLPAGVTAGAVEILWNGEVIDSVSTGSGVFETHTLSLQGTGEPGTLTFRNVATDGTPASAGPEIHTDAPIYYYNKDVDVGGQSTEVAAFAPGQAKLYQVIDGQLKVFDTAENEYADAGPMTGLKVNAIGFNAEDDLIYGIAKASGTDALGNAVSTKDLVMMDAHGNAYRVGDTPVGDYVGDFDDAGNLWTFQGSINRITKIDVDNLDANGNPVVENYYPPANFLSGNVYDIAFNAQEQAFYAIQAPGQNGGNGMVHKIDISAYDGSGSPEITSIPISGTLFEGEMMGGMPKGAFGAVFMDGDGNLYGGLNRGDHDLDGATGAKGSIYKINMDFDAGQAYAEFMAESQSTGNNDGAADPRSIDPFAVVDQDATVQIRLPELSHAVGGDDSLRGGAGDDEMHGNMGDDELFGGTGQDTLSGDEGDDRVFGGDGDDTISGGTGLDYLTGGAGADSIDGGADRDIIKGDGGNDSVTAGTGNDVVYAGDGDDTVTGDEGNDILYGGDGADQLFGGLGADKLVGGAGDDVMDGGNANDFLQGGTGNDTIQGGGGGDKIVGGAGEDVIEGGAGADHIWGGQWWRDGSSDTFVYNKGGGRDTIHDFEVDHDKIDLSSYGLTFEDIQDRIVDRGWATEINLQGIDKSGANDKIMLKAIKPDELDEGNFIV